MGDYSQATAKAMAVLMSLVQYTYPFRHQTRSADGRDFFLSENFGELEFDWAADTVSAKVLDAATGRPVLSRTMSLAELRVVRPAACFPHPRGSALSYSLGAALSLSGPLVYAGWSWSLSAG